MKKSLKLTVGVFVLFLGTVSAQETTLMVSEVSFHKGLIGFRFMPTVSAFNVKRSDGVVQSDFTFGYGFGGLVGVNFNKNIGLQLELQYNSLSQKYSDQSIDRRVDIKYVNVPLLISFNTNRESFINLNAVIGPQIGFNVGSKLTTSGIPEESDVRAILAVKQNDFGFAYGLGIDFGLNKARSVRLDLGFRGVQGLIDISDNNNTQETNSYYILDKSRIKSFSIYGGLTFLVF